MTTHATDEIAEINEGDGLYRYPLSDATRAQAMMESDALRSAQASAPERVRTRAPRPPATLMASAALFFFTAVIASLAIFFNEDSRAVVSLSLGFLTGLAGGLIYDVLARRTRRSRR